MRKYLASLFVMGTALVASPLAAAPAAPENRVEAAVAVPQVHVGMPVIRDEAAMVLIGTALIGLAAAVKRSA